MAHNKAAGRTRAERRERIRTELRVAPGSPANLPGRDTKSDAKPKSTPSGSTKSSKK